MIGKEQRVDPGGAAPPTSRMWIERSAGELRVLLEYNYTKIVGEFIRKTLGFVWETIESFTFALALFVVSYLFFFQPGIVHGTSSYPTWQENERFVTSKIAYMIGQPQRGDFVVVKSPQNADIDFIKRIVGMPGEKIKISNCQVYINNRVLDESGYLQPGICTGPESFLTNDHELAIPADFYFLLGDNREHSSDSRGFGPIFRSSIIGKVVFRYWPPERFGSIF